MLRRLFPNLAGMWDTLDAGKKLILPVVLLISLCLLITIVQEFMLAVGILHQ